MTKFETWDKSQPGVGRFPHKVMDREVAKLKKQAYRGVTITPHDLKRVGYCADWAVSGQLSDETDALHAQIVLSRAGQATLPGKYALVEGKWVLVTDDLSPTDPVAHARSLQGVPPSEEDVPGHA